LARTIFVCQNHHLVLPLSEFGNNRYVAIYGCPIT
jgi:hypothetical protein